MSLMVQKTDQKGYDAFYKDYRSQYASVENAAEYVTLRVMKPGANGYFADGFGENKVYHIFHDKELMDWLDRKVPSSSRAACFLSGSVVTQITNE